VSPSGTETARLARLRGTAQRLHRPPALGHPVDVIRGAGPVQAQEPRAAKLAFRARSRRLTAIDVDRARTEERSLLRAWCMRRTVHLICAEDAGWLLPLFSHTIVRLARKRLADFGLDRRGQDRALKLLHEAVNAEGALTRPELAERLERAGFDTANEFKVHLWVLATLDGELCLGPDRGASACLVRTADWLGELERRPREESLAELARRYLRAYGPADERDLARWSGLALRDARLGFERIVPDLRAAGELFTLGPRPRLPRPPVVRMLGGFDNYDLGYVDRTVALDAEHEKRVNPGGGIVRPAVVVDGRYVATWSSKRSGKRLAVSIEPFGRLTAEVRRAIEAEVADLGRFEALDATIA
jgi:hypothetical protein